MNRLVIGTVHSDPEMKVLIGVFDDIDCEIGAIVYFNAKFAREKTSTKTYKTTMNRGHVKPL